MATPGREKLRRRREEQEVCALAAIELSFSRLNSNGGGARLFGRRQRKKTNGPSGRGEKQ